MVLAETILSFCIQLTSQLFITCSWLWLWGWSYSMMALPNWNFDNYQILNFSVQFLTRFDLWIVLMIQSNLDETPSRKGHCSNGLSMKDKSGSLKTSFPYWFSTIEEDIFSKRDKIPEFVLLLNCPLFGCFTLLAKNKNTQLIFI